MPCTQTRDRDPRCAHFAPGSGLMGNSGSSPARQAHLCHRIFPKGPRRCCTRCARSTSEHPRGVTHLHAEQWKGEKKEHERIEGMGAGYWGVFVLICRALGQAVCITYKHTRYESRHLKLLIGSGNGTGVPYPPNRSKIPTLPALIPRWALRIGRFG